MLWVRSACLLRPLGPQGKLQLAKDLGELQMVVGQGLFPQDALGPAHRWVDAELELELRLNVLCTAQGFRVTFNLNMYLNRWSSFSVWAEGGAVAVSAVCWDRTWLSTCRV